jgi:phosphoribosylformylglycinamidine (FGAM) synthase-like enzyme
VAEAYRNLSAVGATPIAITDNLNFGNPEKPDTMGVIVKAIEGMAEACRVLEFPVVSGNVSLYNETDGVGIPPTPVVGGIGLIENLDHVATLKGAQDGDVLFLIGPQEGTLGASAYARTILGLDGSGAGAPPSVDLGAEKKNATLVRALIHDGLAHAVHDVSEGGIACAAAEMALSSNATTTLYKPANGRALVGLFGERNSAYLIAADLHAGVQARAEAAGVAWSIVGDFTRPASGPVGYEAGNVAICLSADELTELEEVDNGRVLPLSTLRAAHEGWLPGYMKGAG